jgi:hypothetical protein
MRVPLCYYPRLPQASLGPKTFLKIVARLVSGVSVKHYMGGLKNVPGPGGRR